MKGFTAIEFLITIAIIGLLSAMMFSFNSSLREQFFLFKDQNHLYNVFMQVKNLTLASYTRDPENVCGYGISFLAPRNVIIYKNYKDKGADCFGSLSSTPPTNHNFYYSTGNNWPDDQIINEQNNATTSAAYSFQLDPSVSFDFSRNGDNVNRIDILFVAPKPTVFITENGDNFISNISSVFFVGLKTTKGSTGGIKIDSSGFSSVSWINN